MREPPSGNCGKRKENCRQKRRQHRAQSVETTPASSSFSSGTGVPPVRFCFYSLNFEHCPKNLMGF
jgi:hypothetical protein